ncbi:MAG: DUF4276 family protein [Magnetococcales bacterium]|nr:DUF4276 family protein [Magnetococcales bacterium]
MQVVIFLEEESARALLQELLPRLFPDCSFRYIVFEGKQDLEKQLVGKLRGWRQPGCRFVVLRDRDAGDWQLIKAHLATLCQESGKEDVLIRIACRELESWYLGDLDAVAKALDVNVAPSMQNRRGFRHPDALDNPVQELVRLAPHYQKVAGSRAMGKVMGGQKNRSCSFNVFLSGIGRMCQAT